MSEILNQAIPQGWVKATLGEVTERIDKVKPKNEPEKEILYLDIGGIEKSKNTVVDYKTYLGKDAPSRAQQLIKFGDIAFANVRPYLRNIAIIPAKLDGHVGSTGFCFLRASKVIENKYLFYWVLSDAFIRDISQYQKGSSYPAVTNSAVYDRNILLPPLKQQKRIVTKIEELFSHIDAGIKALNKSKELLKQYRQSVLKAAVTGELTKQWREDNKDKLEPASELLARILVERREQWEAQQMALFEAKGKVPKNDKWKEKYKEPLEYNYDGELPDIPKSWCWVSPESLASTDKYSLAIGPFGSNLKVVDYRESGVPLVFVRNIRSHNYDLTTAKFVDPDKAESLKAHSISAGDVLITKMGEPPGDADIYPLDSPDAIITADCIKWRFSHFIEQPKLYVHLINSSFIKFQIVGRTKGVAQKKISLATFKSVAFPLPPLEEQKEILSEIEMKISSISRLESEIDIQLAKAQKTKQSILASAFSGKLI